MTKEWLGCIARDCWLDREAHARKYAHIEETVGRRAADEFADEHQERDPYEVYGTPEHEAWLIEMERFD